MDPRLQNLSYSSRLQLHACPQKFRLYKLRNPLVEVQDRDGTGSITFAFGHAVGTGVQDCLQGMTEDQWLLKMFLEWPEDLLAVDEKRKKSFWYACIAVQKFAFLRQQGLLLKGYELMQYGGKPACELGFCISLPHGFKERGYLDAALQHQETGKIAVLECKTTWFSNVNSAQYKNSSQAIGYSVVLDKIAGEYSDYTVYYPVYVTTRFEWEVFPFTKRFAERAGWLQELLFDISDVQRYEETGHYPRRGESCIAFGRECEYFGSCTLSIRHLTTPLDPAAIEKLEKENAAYQIQVSFEELLEVQMQRAESLQLTADSEQLEVAAVAAIQERKKVREPDLSNIPENEML